MSFFGDRWRQKTRPDSLGPWAIVWRCLRDPICLSVSVQHRLVIDRQTENYGIYRASMASRGKKRSPEQWLPGT